MLHFRQSADVLLVILWHVLEVFAVNVYVSATQQFGMIHILTVGVASFGDILSCISLDCKCRSF